MAAPSPPCLLRVLLPVASSSSRGLRRRRRPTTSLLRCSSPSADTASSSGEGGREYEPSFADDFLHAFFRAKMVEEKKKKTTPPHARGSNRTTWRSTSTKLAAAVCDRSPLALKGDHRRSRLKPTSNFINKVNHRLPATLMEVTARLAPDTGSPYTHRDSLPPTASRIFMRCAGLRTAGHASKRPFGLRRCRPCHPVACLLLPRLHLRPSLSPRLRPHCSGHPPSLKPPRRIYGGRRREPCRGRPRDPSALPATHSGSGEALVVPIANGQLASMMVDFTVHGHYVMETVRCSLRSANIWKRANDLTFFKDHIGVDLYMEPNFEDYSCQESTTSIALKMNATGPRAAVQPIYMLVRNGIQASRATHLVGEKDSGQADGRPTGAEEAGGVRRERRRSGCRRRLALWRLLWPRVKRREAVLLRAHRRGPGGGEPAAVAVGGERLPVVVYFHGGGFVIRSATSPAYHRCLNDLAIAYPAVVVSVNYRVAPSGKIIS
uniref:Alpha/beta hydrolase fold-3 domain-containing protein n=1 Tax=Oryza sativa subsp. japonica TaxID=39947 RepID=Q65XT6_ORYSJ|nr:hypothetical protein [Oryza sativa Japonica Group]